MKISKYLIIMMISSIDIRQITQFCVCRHVDNQYECQGSHICIWNGEKCDLRLGETYIQQIDYQDADQCYKYIQEDCIQMEMCGFYLGECIRFTECGLFQKNQCQESSVKCVSDGQNVLRKKDVMIIIQQKVVKIKIQMEIIIIGIQMLLLSVKMLYCTQLPYYLMSDNDCRNAMYYFTVNDLGYGCEDGKNKCEEYTKENKCYFTYYKKIECFWDRELQMCFTKNCENKQLKTYDECNSYMQNCTTNGIHCFENQECQFIKNEKGCVVDINNKKSAYSNGKCELKNCNTAPLQYNSYEQCQQYDEKLDCVRCQNRPIQCQNYYQEIDCYSIIIQDCVWYKNKCDKRQCYHAPQTFVHEQCQQYGKCMRKIEGGCELRPQTCEEIIIYEFCDISYDESRCMWEENQCKQLTCQNLKLPNYDNSQKCKQASKHCRQYSYNKYRLFIIQCW
ncbi:unnamed protein product [Paramecium sonneborni]|uniref:Uncharacterized protein n=1 Tax=Paramecium sonneborni TaxID=65129 RepID=A0A8S1RNH1_9CILI|nr:unnamed protein product [Paramecium sonneborni]